MKSDYPVPTGVFSRIGTEKEARRTLHLTVIVLVAAAVFQTVALWPSASAWRLLPAALGAVALLLRLVPRPVVAGVALVVAVAVLVLQLGRVVYLGRPGYGTLAVGAVAVWAATRALQALAALRQWQTDREHPSEARQGDGP